MSAPLPPDEPARLQALRLHNVLDTPPEEEFDRIARIARGLFRAPIALISFIDEKRQWFKSTLGLSLSETPRDVAICAYTILSSEVMVVPDTLADSRFADYPLVARPPQIRFYAGTPLTSSDGFRLGTLCIADKTPRETLDEPARRMLADLGAAAANALANRAHLGENLLALIAGSLPMLVAYVDTEQRFRFVNKRHEEWLGVRRERVLGRTIFEITGPETYEVLRPFIGEALAGHEARFERSLLTDNGATRILRANYVPDLDAEGHVRGFVAFAEDITENSRLEQQLRQALKMEAIGRLAGGVAHDFNNLLTVILGRTEMVSNDMAEDDPLREGIDEIARAAERAAGLTQQLLAFGRQQILEVTVLDLNRIVVDLEKMLGPLLGEDIALITALHPGLSRVKADAGQIEQVIVNLALNARDAMPSGGAITIETGEAVFDAEYVATHAGAQPGRYVVLRIRDTGIGMDPVTQEKIFEPFFTTKGVGKGAGLGLATVYGIVKQSGGYIWVNSEPGRGSTFEVYLPLVAETAPEPAPVARFDSSRRGDETILLVEDEDELRRLLRLILDAQGYNVIEARNGKEALVRFREAAVPIGLVLTDVVMPEMSGREMVEHLRRVLPAIPVLYMSGYTNETITRPGVSESNTQFIQKPFSPRVLTEKVRSFLDSKK